MPRLLLSLELMLAVGLASCAAAPRSAPSSARAGDLAPANPAVMSPYDDDALREAANARHARQVPNVPGRSLVDLSASSELFAAGTPATSEVLSVSTEPLPATPIAPTPMIVPMQLAAHLEAIAAAADDPVPAHFARALLPLLLQAIDEPTITVDDFESRTDLTESERQLLHETAVFAARANTRLQEGETARLVLEEELVRLLEAIRDPEPFAITFATLIDEVRGVGDFTARGSSRFLKGVNHDARIYMDFEGVAWTFDGTNWSTELELQVQVLKSDGYQVLATKWEPIHDTRARRVAVYAWSSVVLADDLGLGKYVIKIRARQPDSKGFSEHILPFEIVSRLAGVGARE
jgi:hypothetical protein